MTEKGTTRWNRCLVCDHPKGSPHFGSITCLACAAFFRRTVALNIVFKCVEQRQCNVFHELRMICRACRFDKCISSGLLTDMVQKRRTRTRGTVQPSHLNVPTVSNQDERAAYAAPVADVYRSTEERVPTWSPGMSDSEERTPNSVQSDNGSVSESALQNTPSTSNCPNTVLPKLRVTGIQLLNFHVSELRRSMDRRCVVFAKNPMRAVVGNGGKVPYEYPPHRKHTLPHQMEAQKLDHLLALDYCLAMPGYNQLSAEEKMQLYKISAIMCSVLDISWITVQVTKPSDLRLMFTDGSVASVRDAAEGWEDETEMKGADKVRTFFDFVERYYDCVVLPLFEMQLDEHEYAALKAFCVWKFGYCEYTQNLRRMGKEHETGLLLALNAHYQNREDKALRMGNLILLMGSIYEVHHLCIEKYRGFRLFDSIKIDEMTDSMLNL